MKREMQCIQGLHSPQRQQQLEPHQKGLKKGPNTGLSLYHNAIICSTVFYTHLQSPEDLDL